MAYLGIKPSGYVPRINRSHPHAQGMVAFFVFHEGGGATVTNLVSGLTGSFVSGPTWVPDRNQNGGYAVNFSSASSQYIDLGNPSQLDMNASGSMAVCASYYHPTKPNFTNFIVASKGSQWALDVEGPNSSGRFYINNGSGGGFYSEGRNVVDGDNRVIGGAWDGANTFGYVAAEGRMAASGTAIFATLPSTATSTRIGIGGSGNGAFNGQIGWVAIWNRYVPPNVMAEFQVQPFAMLERTRPYFLFGGGAPATQTITANLLASSATVFSHTVAASAGISVNLLSSTSTIYSATVTTSQVISANLLSSSAQLFSATVTASANIAASLIPSGETIYSATVSNGGTIVANLIPSGATIHSATVTASATISANLLGSSSQFFGATISNAGTIAPTLLGPDSQVFSHTVTPGAVNIAANLIPSGETIYSHTVTLGGGATQTITASLLSSGAQVFSHTVTPGSVSISPSLISSGAQIFSHVVGNAGTINASLIPSGATFHNATVTPGAVTITASFISSGAQVYSHTIFSGTVITPQFISSGESVKLATLTVGPVSIVAASPFSSTLIHTPYVTGGEVFYSPGLVWIVGEGQRLHWEVDENGRLARPF